MSNILSLLLSKRVIVAVVAAIAPVIAKEVFNIELSQDQLVQLTALAMAIIGSLTYRDAGVKPVVTDTTILPKV